MKIYLIIGCILIVSLIGIFYFLSKENKEDVVADCIHLCEEALNSGRDLTSGPCLGDPIKNHEDWVCDVAHYPRNHSIDDLPENQCSAFREGRARHFVEVTPSCELIRIY